MVIRNTPSVLRMLENVVIHLSKDLQLPEKLMDIPINIRTIYTDAANAILKDSLVDLDIAIANTYSNVALIDYSNDRSGVRIDSELLTHIFTKMCVLEFLKWVGDSKSRRECFGVTVSYDADFYKDMIETLKTEYKCILHSYGLLEDNKASKPTDTKKKTTKTSKSTTKTTSKSTTKAASKKKATK